MISKVDSCINEVNLNQLVGIEVFKHCSLFYHCKDPLYNGSIAILDYDVLLCLLSNMVNLNTSSDIGLICSTFISTVNIIFNCHGQMNFIRP